MTSRDDQATRGELLVQLRHGLARSTQLAEAMIADPLVGCEARGLLGRLIAIQAELNAFHPLGGANRCADNDPLWRDRRRSLH